MTANPGSEKHQLKHGKDYQYLGESVQELETCRKQDGQDYEAGSFRAMLAALDRFLQDEGKRFSKQHDREFEKSCNVLKGKALQ